MNPRSRAAVAVLRRSACLALLLLGAPVPARGQHSSPPSRPPDGLLERPDLQEIVNAQVRRDGAALTGWLADVDPVVRARAAFALASVQDPAAVPPLLATLGDPDPAVRADAAFALGQTADSLAAPALLAAFTRDTNIIVRSALLEALGKTGGSAALAAVAALELGPGERGAHALALGRFGLRGLHDPAAVARLATYLTLITGDPSEARLGEQAAYYFGRVRDTTAWATVADTLRRALDAEPLMAGAPDAPSPALHLIPALARLNAPGDTPLFLGALTNGADWRVRVQAVRALARRTAEDAARAALLEALDDTSLHVAVEAATVLATADSLAADAVSAIAAMVTRNTHPWQVTTALLPALVRSGEPGLALLWITMLDRPEPPNGRARARALTALGFGDDRPGFLVLEEQADDADPQIAAAAITALAARWSRGAVSEEATVERYYAVFSAALSGRDLATASAAAPVLADTLFRSHGGLALLAETYRQMRAPNDIEPMVEILTALGASGDHSVRPTLDAALAHPQPVLRGAAAAALTKLTGEPVTAPPAASPPERTVAWPFLQRLGPRPQIVLETPRGRIVIGLEVEQAPLTAQTLLQFAEGGRYDEVPFHRVVANFVVQGGDFERGDGYGGPGFAIASEFTRIPYRRGAAGMASAGKDTEGSQYFFTHSMQPHLDGRYTAFGAVVEGLDVMDAIVEGDRVTRATAIPTPYEPPR
ncbi:MAG: peptidylprolyl isomerase [Gemmatimonadota bacterium]